MEYNCVEFPAELLSKLNCDTYVVYSPNSNLNITKLREQFNITSNSEMDVRTNKTIVDKTIIGEKLGYTLYEYPDRDSYGMCCRYSEAPLKIMKLPSDILIDGVLKFIPRSREDPERLYFNIFRLHFNEDGTYVVR